jgi:hypothetical protein
MPPDNLELAHLQVCVEAWIEDTVGRDVQNWINELTPDYNRGSIRLRIKTRVRTGMTPFGQKDLSRTPMGLDQLACVEDYVHRSLNSSARRLS